MAKHDNDLFERLRQVGLRKQVAKTLSGIGEGAGKKARTAAQSAVSELRSVADEIERRMPGTTPSASTRGTRRSAPARTGRASTRSSATAAAARTSRSAAKPRASRSRGTAASPATRTRRTATGRTATARTPTRSAPPKTAAASGARTGAVARAKPAAASGAKATPARAPRGQNKAKILASLKSGPKTASVIAKETGIGTGTVGSTLSKLATSGEVVKAARGYGLPS